MTRKLWPILIFPAFLVSFLLSGCEMLLTQPQLTPTPTPVPTPSAVKFEPTENLTATPPFVPLNKANDAELPDAFRVERVDSGELIWLRSVEYVQPKPVPPAKGAAPQAAPAPAGTPVPVTSPRADIMRLAGIVSPAPGQPGWEGAVKTILSWTLRQDVDVEQDAKYPTDLNDRPIVMIYFKGRTEKTASNRYNLNRMMVRSGYAVVDIHSPTSLDVKQWLNDEAYAREHRLGLWGQGIVLQGRLPAKMPKGAKARTQQVTVATGVQGVKPRMKPKTPAGGAKPGGAKPGAAKPGVPAPATAKPPASQPPASGPAAPAPAAPTSP
ncbi:MAG: thermonuclease family protein [Armatimonadota bacterium]|nr:thermonuclease family protein [Armatimonadota bacterium]